MSVCLWCRGRRGTTSGLDDATRLGKQLLRKRTRESAMQRAAVASVVGARMLNEIEEGSLEEVRYAVAD